MRRRIVARSVELTGAGIRSRVTLECFHVLDVLHSRGSDPHAPIPYAWDGEDDRGELACSACPPILLERHSEG